METIHLFQGKQNLINIRRGPQFKTKWNAITAVIALGCFIMGCSSNYDGEFITGWIFFIVSFVLFYYVLDFHGFQLDKSTHRIRDYKDFLWIKFGKWENLHDFRSIHIIKAHLVLQASEYAEERAETFHYYHLKLVAEAKGKEIFLAEYNNYYKALKVAEGIANVTGIELKDFIKGSIKNKK